MKKEEKKNLRYHQHFIELSQLTHSKKKTNLDSYIEKFFDQKRQFMHSCMHFSIYPMQTNVQRFNMFELNEKITAKKKHKIEKEICSK